MGWYKLSDNGGRSSKMPCLVVSKADPCLFIKKPNREKPLSFVIIYVHARGSIGTTEAIKEVIEALSKHSR
jgi:hypothetical protein